MRVSVKWKDLRDTFKDIKILFRKFDRAKVVGLSVQSDRLNFYVDAGTYYSNSIPCKAIDSVVSMDLVFIYADIVNFLGGKDMVILDIEENGIMLTSVCSRFRLAVGESSVPKYVPEKSKQLYWNPEIMSTCLSTFNATLDLRRAFKRDFTVMLHNGKAIMKSATLWVQTDTDANLDMVLTLEQFRTIVAFKPMYVRVSDRLNFERDGALLSIPRIEPEDSHMVDYYMKDMEQIAVWDISKFVEDLMEIRSAIGATEVGFTVYQEGLRVSIEKSDFSCERNFGVTNDYRFTFRFMLDLFVMCVKILGDVVPIHVYQKGGLLCLSNLATSILLSV